MVPYSITFNCISDSTYSTIDNRGYLVLQNTPHDSSDSAKMILYFLWLFLLTEAQKATKCNEQETPCRCIARACSTGKFIDNQIKIIKSDGTTESYNLSGITKKCPSFVTVCESWAHFSIEPKKVHFVKLVKSQINFFSNSERNTKEKVKW